MCVGRTSLIHKDHVVAELSTVAEARRGEMRGTLQHVQDTLADAFGANQKKMEQVEASKHEGELAIQQAFEQLHEALEERKKALLSELGTIALTQTTALTLQKEQLEEIQQDISHYPEVISHILQTHTDYEVVAMGGVIPTELKVTIKKLEVMPPTPNMLASISVDVLLDGLIREISKFGCIHDMPSSPPSSTWTSTSVAKVGTKFVVEVESKTSTGMTYPHGGVKVQAEMRSKDHKGAVVYGEVGDHRDGTYTITLTPQAAGPHQLLITMDGQHVQKSPHDLEVISNSDYLIECSAPQEIYCPGQPLCVAVHGSGNIYVGCGNSSIYVYDKTGQLKNTIICKRKDGIYFSSLKGLCIKGDSELFIAEGSSIQKLSLEGENVSCFEAMEPKAVIVGTVCNVIIVARTVRTMIWLGGGGTGGTGTIVGLMCAIIMVEW